MKTLVLFMALGFGSGPSVKSVQCAMSPFLLCKMCGLSQPQPSQHCTITLNKNVAADTIVYVLLADKSILPLRINSGAKDVYFSLHSSQTYGGKVFLKKPPAR
jgi:hypothetical protein